LFDIATTSHKTGERKEKKKRRRGHLLGYALDHIAKRLPSKICVSRREEGKKGKGKKKKREEKKKKKKRKKRSLLL